MQRKILSEYTDAPIGTDMMPFAGLDYEEMNAPMDVVMFNHYNVEENLWMAGFWFDFLRGLKKKPFWNTETQTGVECGGFCWANYETGGLLSCQLLDAYCIWRCGESILALAAWARARG